jgi:hypothetical protein
MSEKLTVADLCCMLQNNANSGLAIHDIEFHTVCDHCESTIIIDNPNVKIIPVDDKSVKIIIDNKG